MSCAACSAAIEKRVSKVQGVVSVSVNLLANNMVVSYDESLTDTEKIIDAVKSAGYGASTDYNSNTEKKTSDKGGKYTEENKRVKRRLIVSFCFLIPLMYISMGHMVGLPLPYFLLGAENSLAFAFTQFLLTLPIILVNHKYFTNGFKSLVHGSANMDALIAIGSSAAVAYGIYAIYAIGYNLGHGNLAGAHDYMMELYFESAGTILTLITLGKYLESRSKAKTSDAITKLVDLAPKTAVVIRDGNEIEIPSEDVAVGDIVIVKPGQTIPIDGVVVEGSSAVDESAITGESIPVDKQIGDNVTGATINKSGYLKIETKKTGGDTTLSQIIKLVEEASSSKAPISKLADRVSSVFVPIVITISIITICVWLILGFGFSFALSNGIAVLVISCPCALGLATPTAIMVGTGKGAQNGILIKSAEALETAHKIDTVVLDKTGTITKGEPEVIELVTYDGMSENELLKIASSIEQRSEHPLSRAILKKSKEKGIKPYDISNFDSLAGLGLKADINGKIYYGGNLRLMKQSGVDMHGYDKIGDEKARAGRIPLFFADSDKIIGIICVADSVKETSPQALDELKSMGIEVAVITGDNKYAAERLKKDYKLDTVISEVMPQDKEKEISRLKNEGKCVAMIGDGINDAPALAAADVGIAIGAGTDVAIESADIVLMKSDLLDAVTAIKLSKAVIKNIKENLFWAFFYNSLGIPLAAGVFYFALGWQLNPMFAAAAMSLSSVCVVSNALRLKFFKPHFSAECSGVCSITSDDPVKTTSTDSVANSEENTTNKTEENIMEKATVKIGGMSCGHCSARVEKALNGIEGITAVVDLEKGEAALTSTAALDEGKIKAVIEDAGYDFISMKS